MSKTLKEVLASLDMNKLERAENLDDFEDDLNTGTYVGWSEKFSDRMSRVPVHEWMCTDTMVGLYVYFFDNEQVAMSYQPARKSDVTITWFSEEKAKEVKDFIVTLAYDLDDSLRINVADMNMEIHDDWLGIR